ncbi:MAG: hypothetical protein IJ604_12805 [Prevotella sp.]|nr:hypothetical protein [Prevotella sp.]
MKKEYFQPSIRKCMMEQSVMTTGSDLFEGEISEGGANGKENSIWRWMQE